MRQYHRRIIVVALTFLLCLSAAQSRGAERTVRPEEIKSKRQVIYDDATYARLSQMWKAYYEAYPSEYAYANWMYAARYAGDPSYPGLLAKGVGKYQANAVLLYLNALERLTATDDAEGLEDLEKAVSVDQNYADPWFPLIIYYMRAANEERLDFALRRLLECGIIADEVMDYNYNVLMSLDDNAILVTNGDNDTYPVWILTRILKVRPDVAIVNRSLLNTEWYPLRLVDNGLPRFTDKTGLQELRSSVVNKIRQEGRNISEEGMFGDTLILRLIESGQVSGRPVYFARTVFVTDKLESSIARGRDLGLVILVTQTNTPYEAQLERTYGQWLNAFRTGGLQSWRLRNAPLTNAGRMIVGNYAQGAVANLTTLKKCKPDLRTGLFHWYTQYVEQLLSDENRSLAAMAWCRDASDIKEIETWSKQQGLKCEESVKQ